MQRFICILILALPVLAGGAGLTQQLAPQPLEEALERFSKDTGLQIVYRARIADGLTSKGARSGLSNAETLQEILQGTGLNFEFINDHTVAIIRPLPVSSNKEKVSARLTGGDWKLARVETGSSATLQKDATVSRDEDKSADQAQDSKGTPEILVKGKRTLNTDIERTEDAPQPYVVFGKEEIQRSQAMNLEDFLRTRLPMNTASGSASQAPGVSFTMSGINLRGLGTNQTLILVDGRRMPGLSSQGFPSQPDLNGIPLAAVERIEVLPSTAGGIYGGSATGGVVNVILRRDFRGVEAAASYGNTFDTDTANVRLDASAGFSLEGGRTQVMIAATRSEANNLVIGDRDFAARAIALQERNNPANIAALTTPPLGATVNIRGVGGALLSLKPQYGGTALGRAFTHIPLGYAGPASDNGAMLVANAGRYNLDLPDGVNGLERGLIAGPSMESASLNVRREFGERLEAFLDLSRLGNLGSSFNANVPSSVANLSASAPNNPFQQGIAVRFPTPGLSFERRSESTTVHATVGLIARLPRDWMSEVSYGWSRSRLQTVFTSVVLDSVGTCVLSRGVAANVDPDGAGSVAPCAQGDPRPALNILQEGNTFPIDFTPYLLPSPNTFDGPYDTILKNGTLRLSGPVGNLPGGPLRLSTLIEFREERMEDGFLQNFNTTTRAPDYTFIPHRSQNADSWYLEARAPLISASNALPLARELELQVSVRHDEYEAASDPNFGFSVPSRDGPFPALNYTVAKVDSTDYTLGLRYAPLEYLTMRMSFGTGFLPPSVTQIASSQVMATFSLGTDPGRGNTPMYVGVPFTFIQSGSPDLKPEESRSASAGVIITPRFAPGFRLSIDYTRIEKVDEIQTPDSQFLLDNESAFPGRILRGANLAGDPSGWSGPITSFDSTLINIAKTSVEACDIQADYTWVTERFGEFHGYAIATRQSHYLNQLRPIDPVVDRVGFTGGPLEWRGNLGLDWTKGSLALSWNAQYYDSYWVYAASAPATSRATSILNQGSATIPRQVYHDLVAAYRFDAAMRFAGGLLANSEISLGIQNLFDKIPPILASTSPTSPGYSTYGDPRLRRYSISLRKSFQ